MPVEDIKRVDSHDCKDELLKIVSRDGYALVDDVGAFDSKLGRCKFGDGRRMDAFLN